MYRRLLTAKALLLVGLLVCGTALADSSFSARDPGRADIRSLLSGKLASQLGNDYWIRNSEHFLIVSSGEDRWANQASYLLERVYDQFYSAFSLAGYDLGPGKEKLIWICFPTLDEFVTYADLADNVDMSWSDGYYSARTNRVALIRTARGPLSVSAAVSWTAPGRVADNTTSSDGDYSKPGSFSGVDVKRATHEAAHQLAFNSGIQRRGVMYPFWVSEGLATNFEADSIGQIELGRPDVSRRRRLLAANRNDKLLDIGQFMSITRISTGNGEQLRNMYAQAWGFFRFLWHKHPEKLRSYLKDLSTKDSGPRSSYVMRRELEKNFGSLEAIESSWGNYLAMLQLLENN